MSTTSKSPSDNPAGLDSDGAQHSSKMAKSTKTPKLIKSTSKRRGKGRGPGRPPGSLNRATIARMKAEQEAIDMFRSANFDMPTYSVTRVYTPEGQNHDGNQQYYKVNTLNHPNNLPHQDLEQTPLITPFIYAPYSTTIQYSNNNWNDYQNQNQKQNPNPNLSYIQNVNQNTNLGSQSLVYDQYSDYYQYQSRLPTVTQPFTTSSSQQGQLQLQQTQPQQTQPQQIQTISSYSHQHPNFPGYKQKQSDLKMDQTTTQSVTSPPQHYRQSSSSSSTVIDPFYHSSSTSLPQLQPSHQYLQSNLSSLTPRNSISFNSMSPSNFQFQRNNQLLLSLPSSSSSSSLNVQTHSINPQPISYLPSVYPKPVLTLNNKFDSNIVKTGNNTIDSTITDTSINTTNSTDYTITTAIATTKTTTNSDSILLPEPFKLDSLKNSEIRRPANDDSSYASLTDQRQNSYARKMEQNILLDKNLTSTNYYTQSNTNTINTNNTHNSMLTPFSSVLTNSLSNNSFHNPNYLYRSSQYMSEKQPNYLRPHHFLNQHHYSPLCEPLQEQSQSQSYGQVQTCVKGPPLEHHSQQQQQ